MMIGATAQTKLQAAQNKHTFLIIGRDSGSFPPIFQVLLTDDSSR